MKLLKMSSLLFFWFIYMDSFHLTFGNIFITSANIGTLAEVKQGSLVMSSAKTPVIVESISADTFSKYVFPSTIHFLRFSRYEFKNLPETLFHYEGFLKMKKVTIEYSSLQSLPGGLFNFFREMDTLDLKYNKLKTLPDNLFANNLNLAYLNLKYNKLEELPSGIFKNNPKIRELDLSDNNLTYISNGVFQSSLHLIVKLSLKNNAILCLPNYFLHMEPGQLDVTHNCLNVLTKLCHRFDCSRQNGLQCWDIMKFYHKYCKDDPDSGRLKLRNEKRINKLITIYLLINNGILLFLLVTSTLFFQYRRRKFQKEEEALEFALSQLKHEFKKESVIKRVHPDRIQSIARKYSYVP